MPLPTLPTPPSRDDPTNFSPRADAFLAALPAFGEAANSLEQSLQMVATTGTSTTSLAIGTGSKTLTTQAGKAWVVGAFVYIASSASVANLMFGQITDYNSTTGSLTVNVLSYTGSGTLAAWSIGLSVPRGGTETFSGTVYASRFEIDSGFALYLSGGVSTILLDTNDLLRFTRSSNTFDVVIGGSAKLSVTANGPERPDDASTANGLVRKSQMDAAVSGRVAVLRTQVFATPGSATYTPHPNMLYAHVEIVGGGGAGGGFINGSNSGGAAGGGGAGAWAVGLFSAATIGTSQSIVVGAGGAGSTGTGGNGGTTSFGALMSASGGLGTAASVTGGATYVAGGSGGSTVSGGYARSNGGGGGSGWGGWVSGTFSGGMGGAGGASRFGGGGAGGGSGTGPAGGSASAPGAGGGGVGGGQNNNASGGSGAPGIVIVTEYCSQ